MAHSETPHIVIVGGGAGGLILASQLGRKLGRKNKARITLIDARLTHVWKPLLHEVAAGSMNPYRDELNYFAQAQRNGFSFQPGRMVGIDRQNKTISLDDMQDEDLGKLLDARQISYDYLVIAIGSVANDFNTPGAHEHCLYMDTPEQAEHFHRILLSHYYRAKAEGKNSSLNLAIVGAGATGVELAAEVHHAASMLKQYGLDEIDPTDVHITLIEAADRILPALSPRISQNAGQALQDIGVDIITSEKVTEVTAEGIQTEGGRWIPAQIRVWAAGIQAPKILHNFGGLENGPANTLPVNEWLQTQDPNIFALGDCANCTLTARNGESATVPPRAQSAYQQAKWLSRALPQIMQDERVEPFQYRDHGSLITLSKHTAVGKLMGNLTGSINVEGRMARLMYLSLYRMHQVSLYGWPRMVMFMIKDMLDKSSGPKLKMH